MADTLSPEATTQLRVKHETMREVAIECNLMDRRERLGHGELRERLHTLCPAERRVLHSRLRKRLRRLNELMEGQRQTFDAPRATGVNLTDEVTLENPSA